jgi:lysophospholipase L1-like esterase
VKLPQAPSQAWRLLLALLAVVMAVGVASLGTAESRPPEYHHYVAMGDSYTAAPYVPLNDVAYGCNRSSNNYPQLVARELRIADVQDRSCSGAQTWDLPGRQQTHAGMQVPPQLDALSEETDLVTMSIGFNNGRLYARLATVCRRQAGVCRLADQHARLTRILDQLRPALVDVLEQVRHRAPDARILLVTYPQLLPDSGSCPRLPRMREQDRETFRVVNKRLRDEMEAAAEEADVEFVDVYTASHGHDVCSEEPWVQGRVGSRRVGAALHPLARGQQAVAELILDELAEEPG